MNKRLKDTATLIREIFLEHPEWNARQIYDRYLILVGDANNAVTLNAVQKHVQVLKERYQKIQDTGLDAPWHLGTMLSSKRHISPEAIPYIFKVREWAIKHSEETLVTIRQAYWIGQFYPVIPDLRKAKDEDIENLWKWSWVYATYEVVCELSNTDFNTTELDHSFWHGGTARPLLEALDGDIFTGTRYMKKASDRLDGEKGE